MKKTLLILALLPSVLMGNTSQAAYWMTLVQIGTNLTLLISALLALVVLTRTAISVLKTVMKKGNMRQSQDKRPMTVGKAIGGLVLSSVLYLPLHSMLLFGDILGVTNSNSPSSACFVTQIDVKHFKWASNASECINKVKTKAQEFAQYTEKDHLEAANLPLLFGIIQLLGLIFFISGAWMLAKHFLGYRDLKVTPTMAIIAMFASTAVMMSPNLVDYIQDIRGKSTPIMTAPGLG